uniref:Uncharacterized protein n=1 Tax=Peronospora matthiolae TaxID=2874970 RepID=A0AAV1U817_9STRA
MIGRSWLQGACNRIATCLRLGLSSGRQIFRGDLTRPPALGVTTKTLIEEAMCVERRDATGRITVNRE